MKKLVELAGKKEKLIVGLMSGTSADGIDAALVKVTGSGTSTRFTLLDFISSPYPDGFKEFLFRNSQAGTSDVADIARLNFLIAGMCSDAVRELSDHAGVNAGEIDLIGSHGQTIHHLPEPVDLFGRKVAATLQIGDPSVIAKLTGITTVGDFRPADVALGGQGAPLVPYFDYILYRSESANRMLLNIGGIANLTYLPAACPPDQVTAFDTGPGNMIVDQMMLRLFGKEFDEDGRAASSGEVQEEILSFLMRDKFVTTPPPKSTGRERYGREFVEDLLRRFGNKKKEDLLASVSEFTPLAVKANYDDFVGSPGGLDELFVSGGGAHNSFFMNSLRRHFAPAKVRSADEIGISPDAKEAICFAVLANETVCGNPANLPQVTGASRATILGKICLP